MKGLIKTLSILPSNKRKKFYFLQVFVICVSLFEVIGFSSIAPFIGLLNNPSIIHENKYLANIYHYFELTNDVSFVYLSGVTTLILILLSNALLLFRQYVLTKYLFDLHVTLMTRLRNYYVRMDYRKHIETNSATFVNKSIVEAKSITHGIIQPYMICIARFFTILFFICGLLIVNPLAGMLVILMIGGIYSVVFLLFKSRLVKNSRALTKTRPKMFKVLQETFNGIKEIKLRGDDRFYSHIYKSLAITVSNLTVKNSIIREGPKFVIEGLLFSCIVLLVLFFYKINGEDFAAIIVLLSFLGIAGYKAMPAANTIYMSLASIKGATGSLETIYEDLVGAALLAKEDYGINHEKLNFKENIILKNIVFSYDSEKPVLNQINIEIAKNATVGIVGASGSGKTTIIDILLGLLSLEEGEIQVDDVTIMDRNKRQWQNILGYVPQMVFLADTTVRENIAFGTDPALIDDKRIEQVAKLACLDEFVDSLKDKYNTTIGEQGVQLSGGQRQRIAIARALYRDVEVLVFDEATSALDGITEKAIMESIHSLNHEKTLIIIAHRVTTLKEADIIYFLDQGRVIDKGTYQELIDSNKKFRAMAGIHS